MNKNILGLASSIKVNRSIFRTFLFLALCMSNFTLVAQDQQIELVRAIKSGELPEIDINCIAQDSAGFLWIGTWKGLYRYDGRKVINYSQQLNARIGRKVSALYLDKKGNLWIGTYSEGLFIYNPKDHQIKSFSSINKISTGNIISISGNAGNRVMIATYDGVFIYDLTKEKFDSQTLSYSENGNNFRLTAATEDSKNNLWIGSDQGLLLYDRPSKKIINTHQLKGLYIHKILELANGWIAVSSLGGTELFDEVNGSIVPMNTNPLALTISAERGESYTSLIPKSQPDQFWVALANGLIIADSKTGTIFSRPVFVSGKEKRNFKVECLFEDRQGIIWVGTNSGLFKYDRNHKPFNTWTISDNPSGVVSLVTAGKKSFWVGTGGKGVYLVELGNNEQPVAERKLVLNAVGENNPLKNDIFSMVSGFDGDIWISTKGSGIVHVKKYTVSGNQVIARVTEIYNEANGLADNHVMTMYRDSKGILWGGCWSNGLIYFSEETKKFIRLKGNLARELKKYPIVRIIESGPNRYYLATRGSGMFEIEVNSTRDPFYQDRLMICYTQ